MQIGAMTLLVKDYEEAIAFYCGKLGFALVEDKELSAQKRWVRVRPQGDEGACLLLARAATPEQLAQIGNQSGGRVFLFLHSDDFDRDHRRFAEAGVCFLETPRREPYGMVAVFADLYGNKWDLIGPPPD